MDGVLPVQPREYYIFSDESMHNQGRYRSISALIVPKAFAISYHSQLQILLSKYQVQTEFGWTSITGHSNHTKCGNALLQFVMESEISVVTLIWDTQDSRTNIKGRDDERNFERMYYQLINYILNTFPNDNFYWRPDEKNGVNWDKIEECLYSKHNRGASCEYVNGEIQIDFGEQLKDKRLVSSKKCVFTQIADLFAGMAAFSYNKKEEYKSWLEEQQGQQSLFDDSVSSLSNKLKYKMSFLHNFVGLPDHYVQMKGGLWTPRRIGNKCLKLNFWLYVPQTKEDRAPIKEAEKEYVLT